jgi:hypothetical protein
MDFLNASCGSLLLESVTSEEDAPCVWHNLTTYGAEVYESVQQTQGYGVSLAAQLDMHTMNVKNGEMRRSVLAAMAALWVHSALVGDDGMLQRLRVDDSTALLRKQLLKLSNGRSMVRSIQHMRERGETGFNLATEAGWHSFEEFDVLAKFHAVAATEAQRVLSHYD